MKIALVVPGGVDRSGTKRVIPCLLWLIERLVAAGDDVHVFALNQEPERGEWPLLGATVHNAGSSWPRLRTVAAMLREHRKGSFDVVHAFWAGAPGQAAAVFAANARLPFAVTLPGGDLAALPDIGYGAALRWRGRAGVRLVLSCLGDYHRERVDGGSSRRARVAHHHYSIRCCAGQVAASAAATADRGLAHPANSCGQSQSREGPFRLARRAASARRCKDGVYARHCRRGYACRRAAAALHRTGLGQARQVSRFRAPCRFTRRYSRGRTSWS